MFADSTFRNLHAIADNELKSAKEKYGETYNSPHEKYAIALEEIEEAKEMLDLVEEDIKVIWEYTKSDDETIPRYRHLGNAAIHCAAECLQIAAVCKKGVNNE